MVNKTQYRRLWNLSNVSDLQENVTEHFPPPRMRATGRISFSLAIGLVTAGMFFVGTPQTSAGALIAVSHSLITVAQGTRVGPPPLESFFAEHRQEFSKADEDHLLAKLEGSSFKQWTPSA